MIWFVLLVTAAIIIFWATRNGELVAMTIVGGLFATVLLNLVTSAWATYDVSHSADLVTLSDGNYVTISTVNGMTGYNFATKSGILRLDSSDANVINSEKPHVITYKSQVNIWLSVFNMGTTTPAEIYAPADKIKADIR